MKVQTKCTHEQKNKKMKPKIMFDYMACDFSRSYICMLCLTNCRALYSRNSHRPIRDLQRQGKMPYNKQLINLESSVST